MNRLQNLHRLVNLRELSISLNVRYATTFELSNVAQTSWLEWRMSSHPKSELDNLLPESLQIFLLNENIFPLHLLRGTKDEPAQIRDSIEELTIKVQDPGVHILLRML